MDGWKDRHTEGGREGERERERERTILVNRLNRVNVVVEITIANKKSSMKHHVLKVKAAIVMI